MLQMPETSVDITLTDHAYVDNGYNAMKAMPIASYYNESYCQVPNHVITENRVTLLNILSFPSLTSWSLFSMCASSRDPVDFAMHS